MNLSHLHFVTGRNRTSSKCGMVSLSARLQQLRRNQEQRGESGPSEFTLWTLPSHRLPRHQPIRLCLFLPRLWGSLTLVLLNCSLSVTTPPHKSIDVTPHMLLYTHVQIRPPSRIIADYPGFRVSIYTISNSKWLKVCRALSFVKKLLQKQKTTAATVDKTLVPDDAGEIAQELNDAMSESFPLGLQLKLPLSEVEAIHSQYQRPRDRLLHVIIAFLKQTEPRPTWRVILKALRSSSVKLPALAMNVEARFSDPTSSRDVVPQTTTGMSPSGPLVSYSGVLSCLSVCSQQ